MEHDTKRKINLSIYAKILCMTIGIIIVAEIISGIVIYNLISSSLKESKLDELEKAADELTIMSVDYLRSFDSEDGALSFDNNWGPQSDKLYYNLLGKMETYYKMMDCIVFLADNEGTVRMSYPILPGKHMTGMISTDEIPQKIIKNLNYYENNYHFAERNQYAKSLVTDGFLTDTSDYFGLFADMNVKYVTVSERIVYLNREKAKSEVAGSIIVALPVPELNSTRTTFLTIYIIAAAIAIIIAIVTVLIIAKRITKPLKDLQEAANKLAKGNFEDRIEKSSNDELGDLVDSFNKMTESLSQMDAVKTEFISNVSHELRTPITSIKGFLEAILDGVVPEEKIGHYLGLCKDESERMNNLINELLDMTRIEFAKANMFEVFDINELITEHLLKMEPQISAKNIDVDFNFEKESQPVCAGKASISRVIINLVHNAVKFTPEGGNITISVRKTGEKAEISVADTGIGIAEDEVGKVFERFYKSDKSRGMDKTGTGLGLAIVKKIMDSHGETIECQSKIGEGTTFIFTLSAADEDENE